MAGDEAERALATIFDQGGEFVQRAGSSGSGNFSGEYPGPGDDRCQPDVLATSNGAMFLFELKNTGFPAYFTSEEIRQLFWTADRCGGYALLAVRPKPGKAFYIYDAKGDDVHVTGAGSRRIDDDTEPLVVIQDPRSDAQDPPGYHPKALNHHGLMALIQASGDDHLQPGDVRPDGDGDD